MMKPELSLASTSGAGQQKTLRFEFTVTDPAGQATEKIVFDKVYRETLTMAERRITTRSRSRDGISRWSRM